MGLLSGRLWGGGLVPPSGLDYGRTPADSLGVLLRWLEGQRGIAAETMRVRVATALAGKLLGFCAGLGVAFAGEGSGDVGAAFCPA